METTYFFSLALLATFFYLYNIILKPKKNLPPSPPSLPILGHLHLLNPSFHRALRALSEKHGPIISLRLGRVPLVVVSSPRAAEECFTKNDVVWANRPKLMISKHLAYDNSDIVWAPYGPHWRNLRRVTTITIFSARRVQLAGPLRGDEARSMARDLARASRGASGKVNLDPFISNYTRNIVMRVINGKPWEVKADMDPTPVLMTMCDYLPFLRWVGYKGVEREMLRKRRERDEYIQSLIDECKESRAFSPSDHNNGKKKTLLEELLDLQGDDPECYTDELLKSIILDVLVTGPDTSARTLEWAMSQLLAHPQALERARGEIDALVDKGRLVDDSDVPRLTYISWIINETLRLFPPTPLLVPHCSSRDCTLGGYHVPGGTMLFVNAWALHRDPGLWDEPTEFRPERWLEGGSDQGFKFMPFGIGRRSCPGNNFALRNISLALATLIQCFDWEAGEPGSVDVAERAAGGIIVRKEEPLGVICRPRSCMEGIISQL